MKTTTQLIRTHKFLIFFLFFFLFFIVNGFSQENDVTECPYFNVFSSDSSGLAFSLISTDVDATISGVIANVIVEQTYLNSGDSIVDAAYVFPMSSNAAVYAMEMIVNGRVIEAVIKRKDEAQTIFDNANDSGLTASLLEQERPNVFQMSLANINPGDSLKVRMTYTELLVPREGIYQFVFPNIVGPRFTVDDEPWVFQNTQDGVALSETNLNINLKINAGMSVEAECTSHDVNFDYQGSSAETILSTNPGDDFIVDYILGENEVKTGLILYEGEDENFFLSMIQPSRPGIQYHSPPREYVFIMDVSGSMSGPPIETSKALITNLLNDLNYEDKFNIIFFAGGSAQLAPNSLAVTDENIEMAINMIDNLNAGGSTWLVPALQRALDMQGTHGFARTFVILTDGYVTVEKEGFDLIRQNLNEANFFAFGIGSSVNRYIIEGIAYVGEGEDFVVTNEWDASEMAERFKNYIEWPVLTNIETSIEGLDVYDVEPLSIPDVFAERPIIIYGKYHGPAQGSITLSGDVANDVVSSSLNFADYDDGVNDNIALKYLWARKRIKLMSDYGIASNESDTLSIEEEITQLGLKYSLVTEYTSFVAVDSNAVSPVGDTGNGGGNDNGGDITSVNDLRANSDKEIINVLGTIIGKEGMLKLKLEHIANVESKDLTIHITDVKGQLITLYKLSPNDIENENIITIPLRQLSSGIYFVSLLSKTQVLDTEKILFTN